MNIVRVVLSPTNDYQAVVKAEEAIIGGIQDTFYLHSINKRKELMSLKKTLKKIFKDC